MAGNRVGGVARIALLRQDGDESHVLMPKQKSPLPYEPVVKFRVSDRLRGQRTGRFQIRTCRPSLAETMDKVDSARSRNSRQMLPFSG